MSNVYLPTIQEEALFQGNAFLVVLHISAHPRRRDPLWPHTRHEFVQGFGFFDNKNTHDPPISHKTLVLWRMPILRHRNSPSRLIQHFLIREKSPILLKLDDLYKEGCIFIAISVNRYDEYIDTYCNFCSSRIETHKRVR